jgi:hypothetical protein
MSTNNTVSKSSQINTSAVESNICKNEVNTNAVSTEDWSEAINNFCNTVKIDSEERQNLIRLARNHGKHLGLMD